MNGKIRSMAIAAAACIAGFAIAAGPAGAAAVEFANVAGGSAGPYSTSVNAAPELATWAMMIIGFGAAGGMVRGARRRNELRLA